MASVYILFSKDINRYYTGSCLDLESRIAEHMNKLFKGSFTSKANDWKLFFSIDNLSYDSARTIELHIKKMKSSRYIENLKKYPEMCQKLIDQFRL